MRLAALALVFLSLAARAETQLVAVMPLETSNAKIEPADRAALEEMLRSIAGMELQALGFTVLTGETTLKVLEENGVNAAKACEASCALEAARELKAKIFLSGSVITSEGLHIANVRMFDAAKGQILASTDIEGENVRALRQQFKDEAASFFSRGVGRQKAAASRTGSEGRIGGGDAFEVRSNDVLVAFESEPTGAVVFVDGQLLCQTTPCSKAVSPGVFEVGMQLERYEPVKDKARFEKGARVRFALAPTFGDVTVTTEPAGLRVRVDDARAAPTPASLRLDPGLHEFVVEDPCFSETGERVTIEKAVRRDLVVRAEPRWSALRVLSEDDAGNALEADVFVDGQEVGTAPGTFKLRTCSKKLEVRAKDGRQFFSDLELRERDTTEVNARVRVLRTNITLRVSAQGLEGVSDGDGTFDLRLRMPNGTTKECSGDRSSACLFRDVLEGRHALELVSPVGRVVPIAVTGSGGVVMGGGATHPGARLGGLLMTGLLVGIGAVAVFVSPLILLSSLGFFIPMVGQACDGNTDACSDFASGFANAFVPDEEVTFKGSGDVQVAGEPKARQSRFRVRAGLGAASGVGPVGVAVDFRLFEMLTLSGGAGLIGLLGDSSAFGYNAALSVVPPRGRGGFFASAGYGNYSGAGRDEAERVLVGGAFGWEFSGSNLLLRLGIGGAWDPQAEPWNFDDEEEPTPGTSPGTPAPTVEKGAVIIAPEVQFGVAF